VVPPPPLLYVAVRYRSKKVKWIPRRVRSGYTK
jgi:hypothetical protein